MIKKPSGLDLKYQNLGTEDAIREYERDTMLWEIYNNSRPQFNPITDLKATYYPDIDNENYDDIDYDEVDILRNKLRNLIEKREYYLDLSEYQDNTIGICLCVLSYIAIFISLFSDGILSTSLCICIAISITLLTKIYYILKKKVAIQNVVNLDNKIKQLKKKIKSLKIESSK